MDASGGVPEPLLPPQMALQNPELVGGELFHVLPALGQILVMIDADGDENYVPHVIPLDGGFPEPLADEPFSGGRSHLVHVDDDAEIAYFAVESREEASITAVRVHLPTRGCRGALAEPVRRDGRRVDSRPLTRRPRGRLHDGGHRPLRDRRRRYAKNALRSRRSKSAIPRRSSRLPDSVAGTGRRAGLASCSRARCTTTRALSRISISRDQATSIPLPSTVSRTRASVSSKGSTTSKAIATR